MYMSDHVFIKGVGEKRLNVRPVEHCIAFFTTSLINSIIQIWQIIDSNYHMTQKLHVL